MLFQTSFFISSLLPSLPSSAAPRVIRPPSTCSRARPLFLQRKGFFNSISEPRHPAKAFGAADTSNNPRDTIAPECLEEFAVRMVTAITAELDSEWIEQEDHKLVAAEVARLYLAARNDAAESDEVGALLAHIGKGLESWDMGECFVGPWEVANMASAAIMRENYPERVGFGYYTAAD